MRPMACWLLGLVMIGVATPAHAFGKKGHQLVGTIADRLLSKLPNKPKNLAILGNLTLEEAATIADEIKGIKEADWDKLPDPKLPWTTDKILVAEMRAFVEANPQHSKMQNHFNFHYTDISIISAAGPLKYANGAVGATPTDVVHMINVCIRVLQGQATAADNNHKITPRVAVVLLAHYVGDIHQPLHVGAAYFDGRGNIVDPNNVAGAFADEGGNQIQFHDKGATGAVIPLHAFWDENAVEAAVRKIKGAVAGAGATGATLTSQEIDDLLVKAAPSGAPLDKGVPLLDLSTAWANEILPMAAEAHVALKITTLPKPEKLGEFMVRWDATEKPGTPPYVDFAGNVISKSIHRAGWRLAELLQNAK